MNRYLELVNEWQTTIGSPGIDITEEISVDTRKMRLNLIFEELSELADAYGLGYFFITMCHHQTAGVDIEYGDFINHADTEVLNKVEALDALADLQYVLSGSVIETGLVEVFDDAMEEVHSSNMSKFPTYIEEIDGTIKMYQDKGVNGKAYKVGDVFVIKRRDGKVLKSINYRPADFQQFIPE